METLWKGRTEGKVDNLLIDLGESISLDIYLYKEDLKGSYAHAKMLNKMGVLSDEEFQKIVYGLKQIKIEIERNQFSLRKEWEDIHTHVENRLKELIGDIAGKLHTGRSRNDQIALDTHLFIKANSYEIIFKLLSLCKTILKRSEETMEILFPSYTHLQIAQPIRFSHYLLSYFWMFIRDIERFFFTLEEADRLPLGVGAVAGVNYLNDREFLKKELGFKELYENSMDAVSSRDHILNFLYSIAALSLHISRLCEDFIIYNSLEFGFIELDDTLTTGSSIMPQKKNPDLLELVRGKTAKFIGHLNSLMIILKGLPMSYNRDLQEDRKPLIESLEIYKILDGVQLILSTFKIRQNKIEESLKNGFATATDLADALVQKKNLPFRLAHHIVGQLVQFCVKNQLNLFTISKEQRTKIHPFLEEDEFYFSSIDIQNSIEKKISRGGTSKKRVLEQIEYAYQTLEKIQKNLPEKVDYNFE
ncbi:MAG: argininosuccinate lyase [Leptonema sp. (in: bacteria)]